MLTSLWLAPTFALGQTPDVSGEDSDAELEQRTSPSATDEAREAELFGEESDVMAVEPTEELEPTETVKLKDVLAVGGDVRLEAIVEATERQAVGDQAFLAPALASVYLDARPNERVRGFLEGRLSIDLSRPAQEVDLFGEAVSSNLVELKQLWLKFDAGKIVYFTVGKQHVKWGAGRFWNPTDFLSAEAINPLEANLFDRRVGTTLARAHIPVESWGANFHLVGDFESAQTISDVGVAARAEFLVGLTEFALSSAWHSGDALEIGADISTSLWFVNLRMEGAVRRGDQTPFFRGDLDIPAQLPSQYSREDDLIPQVVGGLDVDIPYRRGDLLTVGGEVFFNDAGYEDATLYPWLFLNDAFRPFYAGRLYAAGFVALSQPGGWDDTSFVGSVFANLSDSSALARLDVSQTVLDFLSVYGFGTVHWGDTGEFRYGLQLEPNIFLPDGISLERPLFSAGLGLNMQL